MEGIRLLRAQVDEILSMRSQVEAVETRKHYATVIKELLAVIDDLTDLDADPGIDGHTWARALARTSDKMATLKISF